MSSLQERAMRFEKHLDQVEKWVMIALVSLLITVTFLQVFSRYVLRNPFFWTEELARFLFIYVCMIGIGMGVGSKGHYGFESIFKLLPRGLKWVAGLFIYLVMGFLIIVLTWKGVEELPSTAHQLSVSLPVTMVWSYVALPLGGVLMMIHHLLKLIVEGPSEWH